MSIFPFLVQDCIYEHRWNLVVIRISLLQYGTHSYISSMFLMPLTGHSFYRETLNWDHSVFSHDRTQAMRSWQEWCQALSGVIRSRKILSVCPTTGGVNCDHLMRLVNAESVHCEATIIPIVFSHILWGGVPILCQYPILHQISACKP